MFDQSVHDKIKRKNKIFAVSAIALAVIFVTLRIILTYYFIDPDFHFYIDTAGMLEMAGDYILAACVVIIYITSVFAYKYKKDGEKYGEVSDCFVQGTQSQVFSASLAGFLFVLGAFFWSYAFIRPGDAFADLKGLPAPERVFAFITQYPFDFAILIASVLSAVYFFKTAALNFDIGEDKDAMENKNKNKNKTEKRGRYENTEDIEYIESIEDTEEHERAEEPKEPDGPAYKFSSAHIIFSFMPVIWAFLNVFRRFFDMSKSVNSPVMVYELVAFLVLAAYFVSESRMLVERRETSKFFTFAYIAVIAASASALPNLIWSSFWIFRTNSDQIVYAVEISIVIYILSRIYSQIRYGRFLLQREPGEEPEETKTTETAE